MFSLIFKEATDSARGMKHTRPSPGDLHRGPSTVVLERTVQLGGQRGQEASSSPPLHGSYSIPWPISKVEAFSLEIQNAFLVIVDLWGQGPWNCGVVF